jgi:hypothetical protein
MIEVKIEHQWWRRTVAINFVEFISDKVHHYKFNDKGEFAVTIYNNGDMIPDNSLILTPEMLRALILAGLEEVSLPNLDIKNHLQDTIKVRDRLLSLVETKI